MPHQQNTSDALADLLRQLEITRERGSAMPQEDQSIFATDYRCQWCLAPAELMSNGAEACGTHRERYFQRCQRCNDWVNRYELRSIVGVQSNPPLAICDDCVRSCPQCTVCDRLFNNDNGGTQCCDPNALRCHYCRTVVVAEQTDFLVTRAEFGRYIPNSHELLSCEYCFNNNWARCGECGEERDRAVMRYIRGASQEVCADCVESLDLPRCDYCDSIYYPESPCHAIHDNDNPDDCDCPSCLELSSEGIHSYSFKPPPKFHGQGSVFLGWELEVECEGDYSCRDQLDGLIRVTKRSVGKTAYLKSDGSINFGFELVTHPMSYDWAMSDFRWQTLDKMIKAGAFASEDCGLHVHVSKAGFTNASHDYRWLMFWHRNHRMITRIARRTSEQWAAFRPSDRKDMIKVAKKQSTGNMERYQAINPQNSATYEVRVFASTLVVQEVQAALALVDSTVEYTRKLTSTDVLKGDGWSWGAYRQWLNKRPKYQPLIDELNKINYKKGRA